MALADYLSLIAAQRQNFPKFPKDYALDTISPFLQTAAYYLEQLKINPGFKYINTIEREESLYPDVDDFIYYEFIDFSFGPTESLNRWRYLYIPVSLGNEIVDGSLTLKEKYLPFLNRYDLDSESAYKVYPDTPYVFQVVLNTDATSVIQGLRPKSYNYIRGRVNQRHPYGEHFLFTGNYFIANNIGKMIYEYVDYQQLHDYNEITYLSTNPPTNFRLQSDFLEDIGLTRTQVVEQVPDLEDFMPSEYEWQGDIPDLRATGRRTNDRFSSKVRWYEYTEFKADLPLFNILLPYLPADRPVTIANILLGEQMGINLPPQFNTQTLKLSQTSSNNKIVIGTP